MTAIAIPSLRMAASVSAGYSHKKRLFNFDARVSLHSLKPGAILWLQTLRKRQRG
jgi:hypothetical protein